VAVGLSEEFGFKSEQMNFLAKEKQKFGEINRILKNENLLLIHSSNIDHEIRSEQLLFLDKYLEII
jgi:hypothetical protein